MSERTHTVHADFALQCWKFWSLYAFINLSFSRLIPCRLRDHHASLPVDTDELRRRSGSISGWLDADVLKLILMDRRPYVAV